jgi:hypothetical protein
MKIVKRGTATWGRDFIPSEDNINWAPFPFHCEEQKVPESIFLSKMPASLENNSTPVPLLRSFVAL